jgi:hypothetical protein
MRILCELINGRPRQQLTDTAPLSTGIPLPAVRCRAVTLPRRDGGPPDARTAPGGPARTARAVVATLPHAGSSSSGVRQLLACATTCQLSPLRRQAPAVRSLRHCMLVTLGQASQPVRDDSRNEERQEQPPRGPRELPHEDRRPHRRPLGYREHTGRTRQ